MGSSSSSSESNTSSQAGVLNTNCIQGIFSIGFKTGLKITLVLDPSFLKFIGDSNLTSVVTFVYEFFNQLVQNGSTSWSLKIVGTSIAHSITQSKFCKIRFEISIISCPWQQRSSFKVYEYGSSSPSEIQTHRTEAAAISEGKKSEYSQLFEISSIKVSSNKFAFLTIVSQFVRMNWPLIVSSENKNPLFFKI